MHSREKLEQGYTLSRAMKEEGLFSDLYVALVRAGEVAGLLEETLRRAAQILTLEQELARHRPADESPLFFSLPAGGSGAKDWPGLTSYEREVRLILFCEILSQLLMSGVPLDKAAETLSALLPQRRRDGLRQAGVEAALGGLLAPGLERLGIFPGFVLRMIEVGEEGGHLDRTLHLAAETLSLELEARIPG
jgi:type II secretory pathway component PulF